MRVWRVLHGRVVTFLTLWLVLPISWQLYSYDSLALLSTTLIIIVHWPLVSIVLSIEVIYSLL